MLLSGSARVVAVMRAVLSRGMIMFWCTKRTKPTLLILEAMKWAVVSQKKRRLSKTAEIFFIDDDVVRKIFGPYPSGTERRCYYEELSEYKSPQQIAEIQRKLDTGKFVLLPQKGGKHFIGALIEKGTRKKMYSIIQGILNNAGAQDMENIGLSFSYPKPVGFIRKLIVSCCDKNQIILDSFAGSGTTAHAVMALNKEDGGNRKFILVECEKYANEITAERVRRIIKGVPNAKDENLRAGFGGGFSYWELGDPIQMENILNRGALPSYAELARYVFYTATGEEWNPAKMDESRNYIGDSRLYEVYLLYKPDINFLKKSALTLEMAKNLRRPSPNDKTRIVFAPVRYVDGDVLHNHGIKYCQLPFEIYKMTEGK